ncbi:cobalamin-binding protein [Brevibacillus humidisoli]|uniref:cobalamin-binding protein n=1 Tax=Brevibacillus humidisoli TaxID=2895522 RepID=UPI001E2A5C6B|nr:cobalamin-binding protein [Brevibacillus humidisoli]UFJ39649.1 cobalamin-binding protein [Brevibacillus humidisoli]
MRIVSICPSNTEILYYLGLGEQVVGLDDHSDWPPEWQHLPRVGPDLTIDMDKVEALKPDLVVASLSVPGMEKNVEQLEKRKLPHIVLNPSRIEQIPEDIEVIGDAADCKAKAKQVADQFRFRVETIRKITANVQHRPKLYWEWWPNPIYTPGRDNWLTDVSELAGARNVFDDFSFDNVKATTQMVQERDPDHICVVWCGIQLKRIKPEMITGRSDWQGISAIVQNQVHLLEEGLYCRPSPRILQGLEQLVSLIHPDLAIPS